MNPIMTPFEIFVVMTSVAVFGQALLTLTKE